MPVEHIEVFEVREDELRVGLESGPKRFSVLRVALRPAGGAEASAREQLRHDPYAQNIP